MVKFNDFRFEILYSGKILKIYKKNKKVLFRGQNMIFHYNDVGQLHRTNGPAHINKKNGCQVYWIHGKKVEFKDE